MRLLSGLFLTVVLSMLSFAELDAGEKDISFRIFETSTQKEIDLEKLLTEVQDSGVVFIGEEHDDDTAHFLEFEIFKGLQQRNKNTSLALEFFERDVQLILDEYLDGLISEKHFLAAARPPSNYQTAYRPLVEFARENGLEVAAANAPRRYVNMVTRNGIESLNKLSPEAKKWMAPLPYSLPEGRYLQKLEKNAEAMEKTFVEAGKPGERNDSVIKMRNVLKMRNKQKGGLRFANQGLWDATMAYSLAQKLKEKGGPIVMINGSFHSDEGLGIATQLECYLLEVKRKIITIKPVFNFHDADPVPFFAFGDFVILTKK